MPRSTREWALRKLNEAVQSLDWTVYHLGEVAERYQEAHPEIANPLIEIAGLCMELQKNIHKVRGSF